jgi:hypothetical protein
MRKLLLLSVLLFGASWAMAQNDHSQTSPSQSSPDRTTSASPSETSPANAGSENFDSRLLEWLGWELHPD